MAKKYSVIKSNEKLRQAIIKRVNDLGLTHQQIVDDASKRGYKLPMDMLNRYLKHGDVRATLREDQIIWLATRYGVYITMKIGKPVIDEKGKVNYEIGEYNEEEATRILNQIFPPKN